MAATKAKATNNGKAEGKGTLPALPKPQRVGNVTYVPVYVPLADECDLVGYHAQGIVRLNCKYDPPHGLIFNRFMEAVHGKTLPSNDRKYIDQGHLALRWLLERIGEAVTSDV